MQGTYIVLTFSYNMVWHKDKTEHHHQQAHLGKIISPDKTEQKELTP